MADKKLEADGNLLPSSITPAENLTLPFNIKKEEDSPDSDSWVNIKREPHSPDTDINPNITSERLCSEDSDRTLNFQKEDTVPSKTLSQAGTETNPNIKSERFKSEDSDRTIAFKKERSISSKTVSEGGVNTYPNIKAERFTTEDTDRTVDFNKEASVASSRTVRQESVNEKPDTISTMTEPTRYDPFGTADDSDDSLPPLGYPDGTIHHDSMLTEAEWAIRRPAQAAAAERRKAAAAAKSKANVNTSTGPGAAKNTTDVGTSTTATPAKDTTDVGTSAAATPAKNIIVVDSPAAAVPAESTTDVNASTAAKGKAKKTKELTHAQEQRAISTEANLAYPDSPASLTTWQMSSPLFYGPDKTAVLLIDFMTSNVNKIPEPNKTYVPREARRLRLWATKNKIMVIHCWVDHDPEPPMSARVNTEWLKGQPEYMRNPEVDLEHPDIGISREKTEKTARRRYEKVSALNSDRPNDMIDTIKYWKIKSLIICGLFTGDSVLATALQAIDLDLVVTVIEDACYDSRYALHHSVCHEVLPRFAHIVTREEWVEAWEAAHEKDKKDRRWK